MERNMAKQQPQGLASRRNLERLQLELSSIKQGVQSHELGQGNNGTWGFLRYGIGEEAHDQTEADGPEFDTVFNYVVEEPVVDMKFPGEPAPNSSGIHRGEGFSRNASDISNVIGIADVMEFQRAHQEEKRMNFESISLGLDNVEKKIQRDLDD
ncbi:unnamed protein product [Sphenostylis stenocarpa]|uniref:Uncharacterized protein n=1 Tax=Sphenostylis stenocarpa TaxID=92480 RepID=A0AA86SXZ5_9FABA|nr:unnamed protein product [Sphenostylis stenocarpa]